ncbi:MAG: VOC family protein [Acidobacteria bacterium]|nr:VOC family protein [Acidobacteriota bacterium]
MLQSIHHIQITIPPGMEIEARAFYCQYLGLQEIEKPLPLQMRGGFWMQLGAQQIHVGTETGVNRGATKAHIAYLVLDLADWREKIAAYGLTVLESEPIPGFQRFEFRDPFGNRVEFLERCSALPAT